MSMRVEGTDGTPTAAMGGSALASLGCWEVALHVYDTHMTFGMASVPARPRYNAIGSREVVPVWSPPPAGGGIAMHDSSSHVKTIPAGRGRTSGCVSWQGRAAVACHRAQCRGWEEEGRDGLPREMVAAHVEEDGAPPNAEEDEVLAGGCCTRAW